MNFKVKFICLVVIFLSSTVFGESEYIGVGTEFIFKSNGSNGLSFSPCDDDKESSCSILIKSENIAGAIQTHKKICTLKIKDEKVSTLSIDKGKTRELKVIEVHRGDENIIKSLTLDGAKYPIILSCDAETEQFGSKHTVLNMGLTEKLLSGFTDFSLGKIKFDNVKHKDDKPFQSGQPESSKPNSSGEAI